MAAAEQTDTIVGAQVELRGSLKNSGPIHIFGTVIGDITSDGLVVIGESAIVSGPVVAKQVDVSGQVIGSIKAEDQIELQPKSVVKGDLITNRLSIKPGAIFVGKSQMELPAEASIGVDEGMAPSEKRKPRLEID